VILPVKRLEAAKSRLRGAVPDAEHAGLVLAMALDTAQAALESSVVGRLVVVTSDAAVTQAALALGTEVVGDVPDAGLNPALAYAASVARPRGVTASLPGFVAIPADLPALRSTDLTAALQAAELVPRGARSFVADAAGTGTVLLAAPPGARLEPCFGPESAAAHALSGAILLSGAWPSLVRDVDTAEDLAESGMLGFGPRTMRVLGRRAGPAVAHDGFNGARDPELALGA
jgi:2-phospho-L-lactate guanylyltransferase